MMVEERVIMLDIEDVIKQLQLSDATIRRLVREGKLRAYRIGKRLKFKPDDLDTYIEQQVIVPRQRENDDQQRPS